jgi:hypothetical protein
MDGRADPRTSCVNSVAAYEAAIEAINGAVGAYSALITTQERRAEPDRHVVDTARAAQSNLAREREQWRSTVRDQLAEVRAALPRDPRPPQVTDPAEGRHRLPDTENRCIFTDRIVPDLPAGRAAQDTPTIVFLVGQPGAGKSRVTEIVAAALNRHDGFVDVDSDLYKPYHPAYAALLARDDTSGCSRFKVGVRATRGRSS